MSRGPLQRACFQLQPWRKDLIVLRGGTHAELARFVTALGIPSKPSRNTLGHAFVGYDGHPAIVWVQSLAGTPLDHGVLVHELFHVIRYTLRSRGVGLSDATEEAYAYTLQNITSQVLSRKRWVTVTFPGGRRRRAALVLVKAA